MSLRGQPRLSRPIWLQLLLSSQRYRKLSSLIYSLWWSRSACRFSALCYLLWLICCALSEQASDTASSRNPKHNLAIAHWYPHALFASLLFHRGARRWVPLSFYPCYHSFSFVQICWESSPLLGSFAFITPGSLYSDQPQYRSTRLSVTAYGTISHLAPCGFFSSFRSILSDSSDAHSYGYTFTTSCSMLCSVSVLFVIHWLCIRHTNTHKKP